MMKPQISYKDFDKVDIRVGRVIKVEDFPEARKPAYKLTIDFGQEIGIKRSSGQFIKNQTKEELLVIKKIETKFGQGKSKILAYVYKTEKDLQEIEVKKKVKKKDAKEKEAKK